MALFPVLFWKGKPRVRRMIALGGFLLVAFMFLRWFEHGQIYHPSRQHGPAPEEIGYPCEEIFVGTKPKIHGWFFPAPATSPRKHLAVLVSHGNGGNISHRLDIAELLLESGVAVLLYDYRGFGRSTGRPDEEGTYQDAHAAYQWLKQKGFAASNIISFGESLGGAIATELAVREPVGGLILQSTFTCIPDLGSELFRWLPVRWICSIHYNTLSKLPKIRIPVAVMHSREDTLIAFRHAERNFAAANEPKLFCEIRGNHNNPIEADREQFVDGIEKFLILMQKTEFQSK